MVSDSFYQHIKAQLQAAIKNNMPQSAKNAWAGYIFALNGRDDITREQAYELTNLIGGFDAFERDYEYIMFGEAFAKA
jgi:hypothetical protein